MSNPARIGQEAPDLKTPSSPSRITPTRALDDDAEHQMTKSEPPAPKYPYAVDDDGVARVGYVAVDPAQHNKATELQLWPLFGTKLTFARPHMRAFHFQWLSFFVAFMAWFAYAPLLVIIRQDLDISTRGIWLSNVCNVAACVVARFVVGPLGDKYGAVRVQAGLLTFVGICTLFSGLPRNLAELCVLRFFIGVAGATFVIISAQNKFHGADSTRRLLDGAARPTHWLICAGDHAALDERDVRQECRRFGQCPHGRLG